MSMTNVTNVDGRLSHIRQNTQETCTYTCEAMIRAEADPVFALRVTAHTENLDLPHSIEGANVVTFLDHEYGQGGGRMGVGRILGDHTNRYYMLRRDTSADAEARIAHLLEEGVDVPWGGNGHALVFRDIRGEGAHREVLVFDPAGRSEFWAPLANVSAHRAIGGYTLDNFQNSVLGGRTADVDAANGNWPRVRDGFFPWRAEHP